MMGRWMLGAIAVCIVISIAMAKPGVVKTRDGQVFEGDIDEKPESVVVTSRGIATVVDRANVAAVEYPATIEEQFRDRAKQLGPRDVKGRIELARWTFDNRRYDLGRIVLAEAMQIDPNSTEAYELFETARQQMRMELAREKQQTVVQTQAVEGPSTAPNKAERRLLSPEEINQIRQVELKAGENVTVQFQNDVQRRYLAAMAKTMADFRQEAPGQVDKAMAILKNGDLKLARDVRIMNDPQTMAEYKKVVQPKILTGCAAVQCHGGARGGNLILVSPADRDAASYTNFYILQRYVKQMRTEKGDVFGGETQQRLINRTKPEMSLLLQYGLPRDIAEMDHPPVRGYAPIFKNTEDPQYQIIKRWIGESLSRMETDYGIKAEPVVTGAATSQPATEPEK